MTLIALLAGLVGGILIGYFIGTSEDRKTQQDINDAATRIRQQTAKIKQAIGGGD